MSDKSEGEGGGRLSEAGRPPRTLYEAWAELGEAVRAVVEVMTVQLGPLVKALATALDQGKRDRYIEDLARRRGIRIREK